MKINEIDDASMLKLFIALRDRRAQRKAAYSADDEGDKGKQDKIEIEFLRRFNERGIDNVSTRGVGTAYRTLRTSATVADWDTLLEHVVENKAWELLEHRVSKSAVSQYKDIHEELPPGVNISETQVVNFRRK
jgi:hypothetical protein